MILFPATGLKGRIYTSQIKCLYVGAMVNMLFKLKVSDVDLLKLYKREIFDNITLTSQGALIDTEILAKAKSKGYTITEVGVNHYPRIAGTQTGAKLSVIIKAFIELYKLKRRFNKV